MMFGLAIRHGFWIATMLMFSSYSSRVMPSLLLDHRPEFNSVLTFDDIVMDPYNKNQQGALFIFHLFQ